MAPLRLVALLVLWLLALFSLLAGASLDPRTQPVNVRWAPSVSSADREKAEQSLGLTHVDCDDDRALPGDRHHGRGDLRRRLPRNGRFSPRR